MTINVLYLIANPHSFTGAHRSLLTMVEHLPSAINPHIALTAYGLAHDELRQRHWNPTVLHVTDKLDRFDSQLLNISAIKRASLIVYLIPIWIRVASFILHNRIHIVHCNDLRSLILAGPPAKMLRRRTVWHLRGELPGGPDGRLARLGTSLADVVVTVSRSLEDRYKRNTPVTTIYNGVPLTIPRSHRSNPSSSSDSATRPPQLPQPTFITASSIAVHKGLHVIAQAVGTVVELNPSTRWVILGEAVTPAQVRYKHGLQRWVSLTGLDDHVEWRGWESEPAALMEASTAILACPQCHATFVDPDGGFHEGEAREGLPRVILEGMASGTPVICTRIAGAEEALIHGETGFLVPQGDSEDLASRMLELCAPTVRAQMGLRAQERATEFSVHTTAERTAALYGALLNNEEPSHQ